MKRNICTLALILATTIACKKEGCTEEFKTITVTITTFNGNPASLDTIYLLRESSGDTMYVENIAGSEYLLVDDNLQLAGPEYFLLEGFTNGHLVLSAPYVFSRDDCHIIKVSGKDEILLD